MCPENIVKFCGESESEEMESEEEQIDIENSFQCESLGKLPKRKLYATLVIGKNTVIRPLLDTGATTCVISKNELRKAIRTMKSPPNIDSKHKTKL